ncbi:MAG: RNA 2',3'-cyclic phosphodiesterase [Candidatus Aenigmarchaeota archaeon]|nr:RNA 2',3'-cyclic phosphodiesterase [Candidatus Aenigmarchaeota archaeon]
MRCFLAVDLDEALKPAALEIQKQLNEVADVKLVEEENLHFTMKFLGEASDDQISYVKNVIGDLLKDWQPFEISVKGLGAFPSLSYIRVVWLGAPELHALQHAVEQALCPPFEKERDITPHLTLARVRSVRGKEQLMDFLKNSQNVEIGAMTVDKVKLKKSILSSNGPVYEDYKAWELK